MSSSSEAAPVSTLPTREADALAAALDASDRKKFSKHCARLVRELAQSEKVTKLATCVSGKPGVLALTTERILLVYKPDAITPMQVGTWPVTTLTSAYAYAPDHLLIKTDAGKLIGFTAVNPPVAQAAAEEVWTLQGLVPDELSPLLPSREAADFLAALDPSDRDALSTVCELLEGALTPSESVRNLAASASVSGSLGLVALTNERLLFAGERSAGRIVLNPIPLSAIISARAESPSDVQMVLNSSDLPTASLAHMKPALAKAFVEELSALGVADPTAAPDSRAPVPDRPRLGPPVPVEVIELTEPTATATPAAATSEEDSSTEVRAPSTAGETKTCPMCAEDVKAAAVICRFCGHTFGEASPDVAPLPPKSDGPPPEALTRALHPGEELFVWADCYQLTASGTLGVTSDRVLFIWLGRLAVDHAINVERKVRVSGGDVRIEFVGEFCEFRGLHAVTAKEVAATVAPGLIDKLFPDDAEMRQRLRDRHEKIAGRAAASAPKASVKVKGCKYLGGVASMGSKEISSVSLNFEPQKIEIKSWGQTLFTISEPKGHGVVIEGREETQQRLTATRMLALGVFSLAAPKGRRHATSYITLAIAGGEVGIFEVKDTDPMKLRARLSPWLAEH
jgi:hypothetical protein